MKYFLGGGAGVKLPTSSQLAHNPDVNLPQHSRLRYFWGYMRLFLFGLFIYTSLNLVVARIRVESVSMAPTLEPGDYLAVSRLAYNKSLPQIGEIVVFRYPLDPSVQYIKRVIGTAGDSIFISNGIVYINGSELSEPYVSSAPIYTYQMDKIPEGHFFVLGDNRNRSADSHIWGLVPIENLVGRVLFVYWPLDRIHSLLDNPLIIEQ